ncbi:MAG: hypothetical protein QM763_18495 [Agriterribacter sp.]
MAQASVITFIEDREGDIYQQFARIPEEKTHLIIRCCRDRKLKEAGGLYQKLSAQPVAGRYEIKLVKDIRQGIAGR